MPEIKTLQEHCSYVEGLCRVSFWFAKRWLTEKLPGESVGALLRAHTPLLYHALNYPRDAWGTDPECLAILAEAERHADASPADFEEAMWAYLAPLAARRAEMNYPRAVGVSAPASWNCGSLKYDPPSPKLPEGWCTFHIANAVFPQSIFDIPDYLPYCLLLLMRESEIRFGSRILYTSTWLNCRPDFLAYFPQEWQDNLEPLPGTPPIPSWHFGWWGQLVTGRGTINPRAERFVRENGYLRHVCRSSHCSYENLRRHLKEEYL